MTSPPKQDVSTSIIRLGISAPSAPRVPHPRNHTLPRAALTAHGIRWAPSVRPDVHSQYLATAKSGRGG